MLVTYKVHKVEPRDVVDGAARCELVTLHPLDPHEEGVNEAALESRSGEGQIKVKVTRPEALGSFQVGQFVTVTFEV